MEVVDICNGWISSPASMEEVVNQVAMQEVIH